MDENRIISRGELAAIADLPEDVVAFWIKQGLIVGQIDGPRERRQFTMRELRLVLILREARSLGLATEALRAIVTPLREALLFIDTLPYCANHARLAEVMDDVHRGNTSQLEALRSELSEEDFQLLKRAAKALGPYVVCGS